MADVRDVGVTVSDCTAPFAKSRVMVVAFDDTSWNDTSHSHGHAGRTKMEPAESSPGCTSMYWRALIRFAK
jgi:hypothetical protein